MPRTSAAIHVRVCCNGMPSCLYGVKIYFINTHRLTELCDTEGAREYPLGTLGTPTAALKEEADNPLGNLGCTPDKINEP